MQSFPLVLEIVTQFIGVVLVVGKPGWRVAKGPQTYLSLLLLAAILWTAFGTKWGEIDHLATILEFLVPVWLTIAALPFLYLLTLYAIHEDTFVQMRRFARARNKHRGQPGKLAAIVLRSGLSIRAAKTIGAFATKIVEEDGFRSAWRAAESSIAEEWQRVASERVVQLRLKANAGRVGTYQDGKQLDQREHAATKKALDHLSFCQMGHYGNTKRNRYRNDTVFDYIIASTAGDNGLPVPTDIRLYVSNDGQSWYAERKTITGHWFAIGAAGPPADRWFYDGRRAPMGFPQEGEWDQLFSGHHSVNWAD